jgi:hypothetical protein
MIAKVLRRLVSELNSVIDMVYAKNRYTRYTTKEYPFINRGRMDGLKASLVNDVKTSAGERHYRQT